MRTGAVVKGPGENRGAVGKRPRRLVDRNPVVPEDRHPAVPEDSLARGQRENFGGAGSGSRPRERLERSDGTGGHHDPVHLPVLVGHGVEQLVEDGEAQRGVVGDGLPGRKQGEQPGERVGRAGAVDELILVVAAAAFGLGGYLNRGLVVLLRAGGLDQTIDLGVPDDGREGTGHGGERRGVLTRGDGRPHAGALDRAERVFPVVCQRVPVDPIEGKKLEKLVHGDDVFDHPFGQVVQRQLGAFHQCYGSHFLVLLDDSRPHGTVSRHYEG